MSLQGTVVGKSVNAAPCTQPQKCWLSVSTGPTTTDLMKLGGSEDPVDDSVTDGHEKDESKGEDERCLG